VDLSKANKSKRNLFPQQASIGAGWSLCLAFISFLSVITNTYLLCFVSTQLSTLLPSRWHGFLEQESGQIVVLLFLEHVLFGVKMLLTAAIDDVPAHIRSAINDQEKRERRALYTSRLDRFKQDVDSGAYDNSGMSTSTTGLRHHFDTDKGKDKEAERDTVERMLAATRIEKEHATSFGFNPSTIFLLVFVPYLCHYIGVPTWIYIPGAAAILLYLQAVKDRQDRTAALGMVADPAIVKYMLKEMPAWVSDSSYQRVDWLNSMLQRLWPQMSQVAADKFRQKIQPKLDKAKPSFLSCLSLERVTFGTVAPTITGIRFFDRTEDSTIIRMDIEVRWVGDMDVQVKVGTPVQPTYLEVKDFRLSTTVRVELHDFCTKPPCFSKMLVTNMRRPFIDFSLIVANMDVMVAGSSDMNVSTMIRNVILSELSNMALFPIFVEIPVHDEVPERGNENDAEANELSGDGKKEIKRPSPIAILIVDFEAAKNLRRVPNSSGGSFVSMRSLDQLFTSDLHKSLGQPDHPISHKFVIFDKTTQLLELSLFGKDHSSLGGGAGDILLGSVNQSISELEDGISTAFLDIPLVDTNSGTVSFSMTYIRLDDKELEKDSQFHVDLRDFISFLPDDLFEHDKGDEMFHPDIIAAGAAATSRRSAKSLSPVGLLTISHIHCRKAAESSKKREMPGHCFISFIVGRTEKKTSIVAAGPEIGSFGGDHFDFIVDDPRQTPITVKIRDAHKHFVSSPTVDKTVIQLHEVVHSKVKYIEREYAMGQGWVVGLRLEWRGSIHAFA
jgi:Synaptotagmin-like mitochondrial-lipid-binding domain/Calcium-activated chloride channel